MEEVVQTSASTESVSTEAPSTSEVSGNVEASSEQVQDSSNNESQNESTTEVKPLDSWEEVYAANAPKDDSSAEDQDGSKESQEASPSQEEVDNFDFDKYKEKTIKVKVDGKEMEVKLADLASNYSGKVAWDKKFNDLSRERNSFKKEIDTINESVSKFSNLMGEGKTLDAITFLGEFGNIPPHHLKLALLRNLKPEYDRLSSMSKEQVEAEFYKQEAEYFKTIRESDQKKVQEVQASAQVREKEQSLREAHSIKEDEWEFVRSALEQKKEKGEIEEAITPELVQEMVLESRLYSKAGNAIKSVDPKLLNDDLLETLAFHARRNPSFTDQDLQDIVREAFKTADQKKVQDKVAAKVEGSTNKQQQQQQPSPALSPEEDDYLNMIFR